jgi:hypothetical protein
MVYAEFARSLRNDSQLRARAPQVRFVSTLAIVGNPRGRKTTYQLNPLSFIQWVNFVQQVSLFNCHRLSKTGQRLVSVPSLVTVPSLQRHFTRSVVSNAVMFLVQVDSGLVVFLHTASLSHMIFVGPSIGIPNMRSLCTVALRSTLFRSSGEGYLGTKSRRFHRILPFAVYQ